MQAKMRASVERRLADGRVNRFSNRADFEEALPGLRVGDRYDPAVVNEAMFGWARTGQTGCLFATLLAGDPASAGWRSVVVPEPVDDETMDRLLSTLLAAGTEAAQLVVPWVDTPERLAEFVSQVGRLPNWYIREVIDGDAEPGFVRIALRWRLPEPDHVSWVLGFGPFDFMPFTRRSPFTALIFRSAAAHSDAIPRTRREDHTEVHLADLQAPVDQERYDRMWSRTEKRKVSLLDGELMGGAKARVTFLIPEELRPNLAFAA